jgi:hypothetical protein
MEGATTMLAVPTFLALRHDGTQHGGVAHEPVPSCIPSSRIMSGADLQVADLGQFEIRKDML